MLDMQNIDREKLNSGMLLLRDEFAKRGWHATVAHIGSPHIFIERGYGDKLHIFSTTPPTTTYAAGSLANNKFAAFELLKAAGIPQLKSVMASESLPLDDAHSLLGDEGRVVVKPIDGGHGKGITVNVTDEEQLQTAIEYGLRFTQSMRRVIVQQQYPHNAPRDIRLAYINHKFIAAIERIPARVVGDGVLTVKELIEKENASARRGEPYYAELATIDIDRAEKFLGQAVARIPHDGEEVQVIGVANYGAGGELVDVTDDVPEWMIEEAGLASRVTGLYVSGIDYITSRPLSVDATRNDLDAYVLEVNKCPSLAIHDAPTQGKSRGAVAAYVEYLASL